MPFILRCISILIFFLLAPHLNAASPQQHGKASLISFVKNPKPGDNFSVALVIDIEKGWHIYWDNPGDSGLKTEIKWTLPENVTISLPKSIAPKRLTESGLTTYILENRAIYLMNVTLPKNVNPGDKLTLKLKAKWLICKDACVPEEAELSLELPLRGENNTVEKINQDILNEWTSHQPSLITEPLSFEISGKKLSLSIPNSILSLSKDEIRHIYFLPRDSNLINHGEEPTFEINKDDTTLTLNLVRQEISFKDFSGLLLVKAASDKNKIYEITLKQQTPNEASSNEGKKDALDFMVVLLFAFLGGLILNTMPCVFPILSLKALSITQSSTGHPSHKKAHGIAYTFGILASFLILGMIIIFLKQSGNAIGWGFQMQSPLFVCAMIYLFFLIGLNLSGYFEITWTLGEKGEGLTQGDGITSSFFTGILSTAVATPCTAPFMATAVGYALSSSSITILLTMICLGFGLAFPFLLISFVPAFSKLLPRPGMWMITMKQFLAFPMYLSALWLLWVLTLEVGTIGLLCGGVGLIACAFSLWLFEKIHTESKIVRLCLSLFLVGVSLFPLSLLPREAQEKKMESTPGFIQAYSKEKLTQLLKDKKPVFVYATASWCITCKMNEIVLNSDTVQTAFKDKSITVLEADWTTNSPEITAFLEKHHRKGVPFYVIYGKDRKAVTLPQILTQGLLLNAIEGAIKAP